MKVVSLNVKGLCSPNKRMAIFRHLKCLKADIAVVQKTHLTTSDFARMHKLWVGQVIGSPEVRGRAGVLLLIHKNLPRKIISTHSDNEGRLLTATLKTYNREWVLTNVYAPNSPSKQFFQNLTSSI